MGSENIDGSFRERNYFKRHYSMLIKLSYKDKNLQSYLIGTS